jgi:hypothetical protein
MFDLDVSQTIQYELLRNGSSDTSQWQERGLTGIVRVDGDGQFAALIAIPDIPFVWPRLLSFR